MTALRNFFVLEFTKFDVCHVMVCNELDIAQKVKVVSRYMKNLEVVEVIEGGMNNVEPPPEQP